LRFSTRELLGLVSLVGLSLASMRVGGILATGTISVLSIVAIAFAIVAFVGYGQKKAFATGFVIPTLAYLAIIYAFGTNEFDPYEGKLPTTRMALPLFQALGTGVWVEMGTGKELPDYDPTVDPTRHAGGGMSRPGSSMVTYLETPDRGTFMTLMHLLFASCFGYVGGKFGVYVHSSQSTS